MGLKFCHKPIVSLVTVSYQWVGGKCAFNSHLIFIFWHLASLSPCRLWQGCLPVEVLLHIKSSFKFWIN